MSGRHIWAAGDQLNASDLNGNFTFGGTGADGALSISSGTTTLAMGSAAVFVKNYTSISITGTAKLAFSGPNTNGTVIVLKSQGNVTITSSTVPCIDASGMGAASVSGAGGTGPKTGSDGNYGNAFYIFRTNAGTGGTGTPTAGTGGHTPTAITPALLSNAVIAKYGGNLWVGAAGGAGGTLSSSSGTTGNGGAGGGCLVIECAGAWNFTTAGGISVAGSNGTAGVTHGGGGGGGAGGLVKVLYGSLTANSGTITLTAGTGGANVSESSSSGGGGGANAVTAGSDGVTNTGNGGTGATGASSVEANTDYA